MRNSLRNCGYQICFFQKLCHPIDTQAGFQIFSLILAEIQRFDGLLALFSQLQFKNLSKWYDEMLYSGSFQKVLTKMLIKIADKIDDNIVNINYWHAWRISPKGDITLSERFTIRLDCEMDFAMFPFDSQACPVKGFTQLKWTYQSVVPVSLAQRPFSGFRFLIQTAWSRFGSGPWIPGTVQIESFAYPDSEVHFEWRITDGKSPIEFKPNMRMSDFVQEAKFIKYDCITEYSTGTYSCLRIVFHVKITRWYNFESRLRIKELIFSSSGGGSGFQVLSTSVLSWKFLKVAPLF